MLGVPVIPPAFFSRQVSYDYRDGFAPGGFGQQTCSVFRRRRGSGFQRQAYFACGVSIRFAVMDNQAYVRQFFGFLL